MVYQQMPQAGSEAALDERLHRIVDEVALAVRWQHPLLVTAVFRSEITREKTAARLAEAFQESGQIVLHYRVDREHYDIPLELKDHPAHGEAIFFVSNLQSGGGRGYSNAYRALNMHREYLVEAGIRAIFWLTERESRQIACFAPDFWAFRHLVVEFPDLPERGITIQKDANNIQAEDLEAVLKDADKLYYLGCYDEAILGYRRALRKHPGEKSIHLKIAKVQLSKGLFTPARRSLVLAKPGVEKGGQAFQEEYMRVNSLLKSTQVPTGGIVEG